MGSKKALKLGEIFTTKFKIKCEEVLTQKLNSWMVQNQDEVGLASESAELADTPSVPAPADTPSVPTAHSAEPLVAELDESKPAESLSPVAIPSVATRPERQQAAEEVVAAASSLEPSS